MSAPVLSATGQRLYDALAPLAEPYDADNGYALARFCAAIAAMFDDIADLVDDTDDGLPGWARLWDPDLSPAWMLPFTARLHGVNLGAGHEALTEQQKRELIRQTGGFKRGTPDAMRGAARKYLADPASSAVYFFERYGGDPYALHVATVASETPDPAAVERALRDAKPAGIILTYSTIAGGTYATLRDTHANYAEVATDFTDYADARSDPSQT